MFKTSLSLCLLPALGPPSFWGISLGMGVSWEERGPHRIWGPLLYSKPGTPTRGSS